MFLAVSEGAGFTLMAMGQTFSPPTHAAIILSLEGVFAAVASYFILGEVLSTRELLGCALMLISTFIAKIGFGNMESVVEAKTMALCCFKNSIAINATAAITNGVSTPTREGSLNHGRPASTINEVVPV